MKSIAQKLDEWTRRRIRMCYWKQWKKVRTKFKNLKKMGIEESKPGNMPIQEKATGEYPIARYLHVPLLTIN